VVSAEIATVDKLVTLPFASMLSTGIALAVPIFDCAVVIAAKDDEAAPGPVAVTSPVKDVIAVVVVATTAVVVRDVTRPFASMLSTGITDPLPTLL
jgi:hypothetical protein